VQKEQVMADKLDMLIGKMRELELELAREIQRKEGEFFYEVRKRKVIFEAQTKARHKNLVKRIHRTVLDSKPLILVTAPVIWAILVPFALLDLAISSFQAVCFPIYGIPKVKRRDYIIVDRHHLSYLNLIEKLNCFYCSYANGMLAYAAEMAGRVEQYWCPIKHALKLKSMHSRYGEFFDYGNAEDYRGRVEQIRRKFEDLEQESDHSA
jgi:hypothetical protein